ncbi:hypothetical protein D3C83_328040 [compost metagenome]
MGFDGHRRARQFQNLRVGQHKLVALAAGGADQARAVVGVVAADHFLFLGTQAFLDDGTAPRLW